MRGCSTDMYGPPCGFDRERAMADECCANGNCRQTQAHHGITAPTWFPCCDKLRGIARRATPAKLDWSD